MGEDDNKKKILLFYSILVTILCFTFLVAFIMGSGGSDKEDVPSIKWCTINKKEYEKCQNFSKAMEVKSTIKTKLDCVKSLDKDLCIKKISTGECDAVTVDDVQLAKNYSILRPVAAEDNNNGEPFVGYYAVAIAKKKTAGSVNFTRIGLGAVKSCHSGINDPAGFSIPFGLILKNGIIRRSTSKCKPLQLLKSHFSSTCIPGSKTACDLCKGSCKNNASTEEFSGDTGALKCLLERGDLAFVKHTAILENFDGKNKESWALDNLQSSKYQLLCADGTRAPLSAYKECSLGRAPPNIIVTNKNASEEVAKRIQEFLKSAEILFGYPPEIEEEEDFKNNMTTAMPQTTNKPRNRAKRALPGKKNSGNKNKAPASTTSPSTTIATTTQMETTTAEPEAEKEEEIIFELFGDSFNENNKDLLFKSSAKGFTSLGKNCESKALLGIEYLDGLTYSKSCTKSKVNETDLNCYLPNEIPIKKQEVLRWCVISKYELEKCKQMNRSLSTNKEYSKKLQIDCVQASSKQGCVYYMKTDVADVMKLDAPEIFKYSRMYQFQPIVTEVWDKDEKSVPIGTSYYAVAVALKHNSRKAFDFVTMKGLKSCHVNYGDTAGWVTPVGLLNNKGLLHADQLRCDIPYKVSEYFNESCVPNIGKLDKGGKLCKACKDGCTDSGTYAGYKGALRCVKSGDGNVAFVKHSSIKDFKFDEYDFEYLCRNGKRERPRKYRTCNLARIPADAVVINKHRDKNFRERVWEALRVLQKSKDYDIFSSRNYNENNVLFKESTKCLAKIDSTCDWRDYLGEDFLEAIRGTYCITNPPSHYQRVCRISHCK